MDFSLKQNKWTLSLRSGSLQHWYFWVWFQHVTPKYAFCTWLVIHNRLSTGNSMAIWSSEIINKHIEEIEERRGRTKGREVSGERTPATTEKKKYIILLSRKKKRGEREREYFKTIY